MKNELKDFLSEGMKRYKQASKIMTEFFRYTQSELQEILKKRKDWGSIFKPKETTKVRSTKYWDEYPLINASISGTIGNNPVIIQIAINWFRSDSNYPFFIVRFYDAPDKLYEKVSSFKKHRKFEISKDEDGLVLNPDPEDFNLERDFNLLIDEFLKTIS